MKPLPIDIRNASPPDFALIRDAWLKSYRKAEDTRGIDSEDYYRHHGDLVELALLTCNVKVASWVKDRTQLYGWICGIEHPRLGAILHYAYVKSMFRRLGIGRQLLLALFPTRAERCMTTTHRTWASTLAPMAQHYNPYLFLRGDTLDD